MSEAEAEFAGNRVFITGGSKGVGEAIVRRFVIGGATVGTTARSPLPEGNAAKLFVQADISTRDGVDKVVREVLNQFGGGVDINFAALSSCNGERAVVPTEIGRAHVW